jgi:MazG family protein
MTPSNSPADLRRLTELVARLRGPEGCPWDREQALGNLRGYLLEEAHEAAAAIDTGDWSQLEGELGDLLFQVAFLVRLGEEAGELTIRGVIDRIETKMIARHPHVFGDETVEDASTVRRAWERRKVAEENTSPLAGIPESLPALLFSYRMTQKAAGVGFDWSRTEQVIEKLREEISELEDEIVAPIQPDAARIEEELGDTLFTVANLGRHLGIDPEGALARANRKFRRRFERVEELVAQSGGSLADADSAELERLWEHVKSEERAASS